MDRISHFNKFVEKNFNNFLKYFLDKGNFWNKMGNINNYINFITSLNSFNYSFMTNVIKFYFDPMIELDIDDSIKTVCLNCGFTEKVPDFIYD